MNSRAMRRFAVAAILALMSASHAVADLTFPLVYVEYWTPEGAFIEELVYSASTGTPVPVSLSDSVGRVNVKTNSSSVNIGNISITGTGTNTVYIQFGTGSYLFGTPPATPICVNLNGISCSRNNVRLNGRIWGNLLSPISGLQVDAFHIEGAMQASVTSTGGTPRILAGSTTADAHIRNNAGGFNLVSISGNAAGDIEATSSTINSVVVGGNFSGVLRNSGGDILNVAIAGELQDDGDSGTPGIIASTTIDSLSIGSHVKAPIQATQITTLADIDGFCYSSITLSSALPGSGLINIGGSLEFAGSINVPASGLAGRVIINSNATFGAWLGSITVGATTLTPAYSNTASSIGGGSAGRVPFDLHGTDSAPLDGASVAYASRPTAANPIRIRLYGPLTFTAGQMPVSITAESDYAGGEIEQTNGLSGCITSVVRDGSNTTILVITPPATSVYEFLSGYTYRIRPVLTGAATLKCDLASPVPVADWEYEFCVGTSDAADINGNGAVNSGDFNILALNWGHTGCPVGGDVNGDGAVNTADFNLVALKYGTTGIAPCNSASLMGPSGGDEEMEAIIEKMGFESLDDFSAWLEELSEKEQLDVLMEVISRLGE